MRKIEGEWKGHMERIMNEENEWDQNVQADLVEGPVERVSWEKGLKAEGENENKKRCWTLVSKC